MALDHYSPCPGGTGKKIKFCCGDLTAELDKVQRMIEGNQPVATLDYVGKLDAKHPGRPCLLSWKVLLEQMTGAEEKSAQTLAGFLAQHPTNPVALAESALARANAGDLHGGIDALQQAIEACSDAMHERVYAAIGVMGEILIMSQHIVPARGHLFLQTLLTRGADQRPMQLLMRLESMPNVPPLLKDTPVYHLAPADAAWKPEFDEGLKLAARGAWRAAAARWEALLATVGEQPAILRNLSIARSNLADYAGAVEALRKYAALDVSEDDAIEAEALTQLLDRDRAEGTVESLLTIMSVANMDELERRLSSDKRMDRTEVDGRVYAEAEQPPPRAAYWICDRPVPATGINMQRGDIPNVLGQLSLFGKQTDREARVELDANRPQLEAAFGILQAVAGDALGAVQSEQVVGNMSAVQLALSWQWRLPDDTPDELRAKLIADERRNLILEGWPKLPMPMFDGRSPEQAADDPSQQIRLRAAVLLLESAEAQASAAAIYSELRTQLKLPEPAPIDPTDVDLNTLSLVRFVRLEAGKLTDDQLTQAFQRLAIARFEPALRPLATEVIARPNMPPEFKSAAYQVLVQGEEDTDRVLELINSARALAAKSQQTTAPWDLDELAVRIQRQDGSDVLRLIKHIQEEHGREEGIAEALYQILARTGLIGPDGRMAMSTATPSSPSLVVPGANEPNKLWTPEGEAASGGKKSGLWLPD